MTPLTITVVIPFESVVFLYRGWHGLFCRLETAFKLKGRDSRARQDLILLQNVTFLHSGQHNFAKAFLSEQFIYDFVHVNRRELATGLPEVELAVVSIERLKHRVDIFGLLTHHPEVDYAQQSDVLVVLVFDELENDLFLWLNLEHFEEEAKKLGGPTITPVSAPYILDLNCFVD